MDFDRAFQAAVHGQLYSFLLKQPRERWKDRHPTTNCSLLHVSVHDPDPTAARLLLASKVVDVNARDIGGNTTASAAAAYGNAAVLELLCAAGADLRTVNSAMCNALGRAIMWKRDVAVRVLLANGVRLGTSSHGSQGVCLQRPFEAGVLKKRRSVVALLRVKKVAPLPQWDRWLLRLLALELWTTRGEEM